MSNIKLVTKDTDLSEAISYQLDWDCVLNGKPYKVYRLEGYVHTIGGRYGENEYWCCPRDEEPNYHNLLEFNGDAPSWGINIDRVNYLHHADEVCCTVRCTITRNGKDFYYVSANSIDYAYAKAYTLLKSNILEGPINFNKYHYWETEIEGRHIHYMGQRYTLYHYMRGQCCAMAAPGYRDINDPSLYNEYPSTGRVKLDLLEDHNIDWFPNIEDDEV